MLGGEERVSVFLVDDSPMWVEAVAASLEGSGSVQVCGWAGSVREAVTAGLKHHADVFLVDMRLPDGAGIEVMSALQAQGVDAPVVFLTVEDDDEVAAQALTCGGRGYLSKNLSGAELAQMVVKVHRGGYAVNNDVAVRALAARHPKATPHPLTMRERQVLLMLCSGVTSDEDLAAVLHISPRTAKTHLAGMRRKLGVGDRAEMVSYAFRNNLVQVGRGGEVVEGAGRVSRVVS